MIGAAGLWLANLWSGIWPKIALVGAVALALLGVYAAIRKGGKDAARAEQAKANAKVQARVDAVQPPAPGVVEDRLEKGTF